MASQVGQLGGLPAHSGADTALSGADAFSQDDGVAVESPLVTDSQASVALAGEHSLPHAAGSTAHTSAPLIANGSALSVTDTKGTVGVTRFELSLRLEIDALRSSCRQTKESSRCSDSCAFFVP